MTTTKCEMWDMPKRASSKKKKADAKEEVMPFLRNLQDRLDKVEVALEKLQLASNTEHFEDEQKIILTDSIVDEQITEATAGLREDLGDFIQYVFFPSQDISYLDSQTQSKIATLRDRLNQLQTNMINEVIQQIKVLFPQIPISEDFQPPKTKKGTKKKKTKKRIKKKRK